MKKLIYFIGLLLLTCCSNSIELDENKITTVDSKWTNVDPPYPTGTNGLFPLMKNPIYKSVTEFTILNDTDKVAIVSYQNQIKVYPYLYTNRYEIVNDSIGEYFYAMSYCPQTKSAINFNRITQNDTLDLVASGYLYKDNMVLSDKNYTMYWSQMLQKGITNGAVSKNLQTLNLIQTNWKTVVDYFPNAKVFYYEGDIITPQKNKSNFSAKTSAEISNADAVFSTIEHFGASGKEETIHAYDIKSFSEETSLKELIIDSKPTLLLGSKKHHFFTTYIVTNGLTFHLEDSSFPPTLIDNEGTKWNAFGYAFEGTGKGTQLTSAKSYTASWWAWKDFFRNIEIK